MVETRELPKILYVDDEADNLVVFKSAFRRYYDVHTANSAAEAMEFMKAAPVSLVITDQRMPGITGIEFLKSLPEEPETIRMVLTSFSDLEVIIEAINCGKVYKYITKPWDKDSLKITIDKALEALELRQNNRNLVGELKEANEQLEEKVKVRTDEVNKQKDEIEKLLLNILPAEVAEELKKFGRSYARRHQQVTVLFTDFQGFTKITEQLTPEQLVNELDECFRAFDHITGKYGLEKIKTIGDAYMCVAGLPQADDNNALNAVRAALDIQQFMHGFRLAKKIQDMPAFHLRIGLHTGPVVSGVVGSKKFAFDIWGDTVNMAARMEQSGEPDYINISSETFELVKDHFVCSQRGDIEVKGKGNVQMYFVKKALTTKQLTPAKI